MDHSEQDDIVVGEPNCTIRDVVAAMMQSPVKYILLENIQSICLALDIDCHQRYKTDSNEVESIMIDIMDQWRSRKSRQAKLNILINVLDDKCHDVANYLRDLREKVRNQEPSITSDLTLPCRSRIASDVSSPSLPSTPLPFFSGTSSNALVTSLSDLNISNTSMFNTSIIKHINGIPTLTQKFINVRPSNKTFIGRKNELCNLSDTISKILDAPIPSNSSYQYKTISVIGLEGVGKTELLWAYVKGLCRNQTNNPFDVVIWINASSAKCIRNELQCLVMDKFGIATHLPNGNERNRVSLLDEFYKLLDTFKALIIFDDVFSFQILKEYFPSEGVMLNSHNLVFLITSKSFDWKNDGVTVIHIDSMTTPDAVMYLKEGLKIEGNEMENGVQELSTRFDNFPLALSQVILYIEDQNEFEDYAPQRCLAEYNNNCSKVLSYKSVSLGSSSQKTTFEAFNSALSKIQKQSNGEFAMILVSIMAYMSTGVISNSIIKPAHFTEDTIKASLLLLRRGFVVRFRPRVCGECLQIHIYNLIQDTARILSENTGKHKAALVNGLQILMHNMSHESLDHAISVWNYATKYIDVVEQFLEYPAKVVYNLTEILKIHEALEFGKRTLKQMQDSLTPNCEHAYKLLYLELEIGKALLRQSKILESREHFLNLSENPKARMATNDFQIRLKYNIAQTWLRSCEYEKALTEFKRVYRTWLTQNDDKQTLDSLNVLLRIGAIERRLKNYDSSMKRFEKILGETNLINQRDGVTLKIRAKCHRALTIGNKGQPVTALSELSKIYGAAERYLHENHGLLLYIKAKLGLYQYRVGQFKASVETLTKVLEKYKSVYGLSHRKTLLVETCILEIGTEIGFENTLSTQELLGKSLNIYEEHKSIYKDNCFYIVGCEVMVGKIHSYGAAHQKAIEFLSKALEQDDFTKCASSFSIWEARFYIANSKMAVDETKQKAYEILQTLKTEISREVSETYFLTAKINKFLSVNTWQ